MQPVTAAPRGSMTAEQVLALITCDGPTIDAGCELLDADLNVVEDISEDLDVSGASVSWSADATPYSTCQFGLARQLQWGVDQVKLYVLMTDDATGISARFDVGVYCLTTPDLPLGSTPTVYQVTGHDRLTFLEREIGDSYGFTSAASTIDSIRQTLADAGGFTAIIDASGDLPLPADKSWPLIPTDSNPTTWLDVVDQLLALINYDPLWCDQAGQFRSQPHVDPSTRTPEFTFDANDGLKTIVGSSRTLTQDLWAAPNTWIFVQQDFAGTPTEGDGIYTVVNQSDGLSSIDARGLVYPQQFSVAAADQATLEALGDQQVAADRAIATVLQITTGALPLAGQADVVAYSDDNAGGYFLLQATSWTLPLDGGDMTWTFRST